MTSEPPHCYTCHEEIYFEKGSKVPLDPVTHQKHEHKKKEEPKKEDTQQYSLQTGNRNANSRIRWLMTNTAEAMEERYAFFMDEIESKGGFSQGCPTQVIPGVLPIYSMVIFYRIPKEVSK